MRAEINALRGGTQAAPPIAQTPISSGAPIARDQAPTARPEPAQKPFPPREPRAKGNATGGGAFANSSAFSEQAARPAQPREKSDLEKFIGENLISKIGIVILVLGVAIGAKYAIDKEYITPAGRIALGYLFGFGLAGLAVRLKAKYHNFSAVLLSGGTAIMYFITYAAYSYYDLITQPVAFALMLMFTAFTVAAALLYERVVIAHIGLVGAYTIPFLLSDNSGRVSFLFTYMAIINAGILAISVFKYWKSLFYSSFIVTWLVFNGWYLARYRADEHFALSFAFATVFFLIFYLTFLGYKTRFREHLSAENVSLVLMNTFIFYGLGYSMIAGLPDGEKYLGSYTVANAGLHFAVAFLLSRFELVERSVLYLPTALILVFITIAIPVQLEGKWITLAWTAQAVVLFSLGRTRGVTLFEYFACPQMALASVSLLNDWIEHSDRYSYYEAALPPVFNAGFLTAVIFVAAFGWICYLDRREEYEPGINPPLRVMVRYGAPAVALVALYNAFRLEIDNYYHYEIVKTALHTENIDTARFNHNLQIFNLVWQINYTMLFLTLLGFVNLRRAKSAALGFANLGLNAVAIFAFLTSGLYLLSELREIYLFPTGLETFTVGASHLFLRYFSFLFLAGLIYSVYLYCRDELIQNYVSAENLRYAFEFVFYFTIWIVLSSELLNWMDIFGFKDSYKLGLSILWGVLSLGLIALGIAQNKKHLRIGAISLFALTLVKLFFYDIADLDTISKTIVFVSLGILLLVISFLYNKYKNLIFAPNEV